jgi:hypothetical protein
MRSILPIFGLLVLLAGVVFSPLPLPSARAIVGDTLVVVVATSIGLQDISTATLRRAFMGYVTEVNGKRLIPLNQPPGNPNRVRFDQIMLGLTPEEVGRFWVDRRIRDESPPPKAVPSAELAVRVAASLPGAIAYVTNNLLNDKVRALSIDGKHPTDSGYLLRPAASGAPVAVR